MEQIQHREDNNVLYHRKIVMYLTIENRDFYGGLFTFFSQKSDFSSRNIDIFEQKNAPKGGGWGGGAWTLGAWLTSAI